MSIAYQCWDMGVGPTVAYKLANGQNHGLTGAHYVSEGSTLRRHSNPSQESSFANCAMHVQAQCDSKGQSLAAHSKDVSAMTTARFSSSPLSQMSPIIPASPPNAPTLEGLDPQPCTGASPKQPPVSEPHLTTSSVTTEGDESLTRPASLLTTSAGPCEAHSRRLEGISGTITGGNLSKFQGALFTDRGLRVKVSSRKLGVVEQIFPVNGGYVYGSSGNDARVEQSSDSSSSICQASEDSSSCNSGDTGGDTEAQSSYRGPLTKMSALDDSLPIKRPGLSKFFGGKSKSFSSLADVSTVTELAKPNNPYAKRRKMGFNVPLDKNRSYPPRSSGAGIAKKLPSSGSRSTLAVAVTLGGLPEEEQEQHPAAAPSTMRHLETRTFPSRSFSLSDLAYAGSPPLRRAFVRS